MITYGLSVFVFFSVFTLIVHGQIPDNLPGQWRNQQFRHSPVRQSLTPLSQGSPVDDQPGVSADDEETPRTWQDLVSRGNGVHDVTDFISLLTNPDGTPVSENDIFSPYRTEDGKRVISSGGLMATSDECSPRNMSVRLPLNYTDTQIAYYPECTMVQRCGGCCPTQFLSCEPLYKEKIVLKVLRAKYLYPGAHSMQWLGFSSVEVERHLSCQAVCRLQPNDCGPNKRFIGHQCKCQCLRFERCSNDQQKWDEDSCSCKCQNERPCCAEDEDERTCVMYFDHNFCECTLKTAIGASPNATQAEIDAWLASRRGQVVDTFGSQHLPPVAATTTTSSTTTTTTTTTTTPATSTRRSPCAHMSCPRDFQVTVNSSGRCVCNFRFPRRRGRYPRRG